ncbi:MAG: cbb3-type cytochrome c oxidase subunit I [Verrucomicrobia bacterium]|nr:cbb3-type cytochrome c oxidase subunit I [Verrucomicrobiota bacterium]
MSERHSHRSSFWTRCVFSTDHKVIGIQYGLTALVFLFLGLCLMLMMRWQLAYPNAEDPAIPLFGTLLSKILLNGKLSPELYNAFGAMHGTIMVFLGVVPLGVGCFGNYLVPLQIGARDMAFPKLNMASYWTYLLAGLIMVSSFFLPGGAAQSGWTSSPPLANIAQGGLNPSFSVRFFAGQTFWLLGMVLLVFSSLLGSLNVIVTVVQLRAEGMTFFRLPFFVWAQLVTAFLLLLAFPPLEAAGAMQLMDRLAGTSFFMPEGLVITGELLTSRSGGSPLLWQHLFWFLAHPEVYVLILPAMGIVTEIIANNARQPIRGYRSMVYALIFLGFASFLVWAHHMYLTDMGTAISAFFQTTTMIISIPSVVLLTCLLLSLWGGSIRFTTPMLFALAFLPMFGIGGLTGLPLGLAATDIHLHDTTYVIGHFHYVVAPGTLLALFAGIYYWFPKVTGRRMGDVLGQAHFWPTLITLNMVFMPMFIQGLAGVSRRLYDGGATYSHAQPVMYTNTIMMLGAWMLALAQLPFIFNFFWSIRHGEKVPENPWQATTLEWTDAPSPPLAHGNFMNVPRVYRGPYAYSLPGAQNDFLPQSEPMEGNT